MELQDYSNGYGIIYINLEEFRKKRGYTDSIYAIFFEEDVDAVLKTGEWEVNENEFQTYEAAEMWCRIHSRNH